MSAAIDIMKYKLNEPDNTFNEVFKKRVMTPHSEHSEAIKSL